MSDFIIEEDKLETLSRASRRLHVQVFGESVKRSAEPGYSATLHFVVKNRPFTVAIESVGNTGINSEKNARWTSQLVRFDPESMTHHQAASHPNEDEASGSAEHILNQLKSLHPVVHEQAKPTVRATKESPIHTNLDVKLQLLSSKVGCGFRLFIYAAKIDGSPIPGCWALTEPFKVVSKPEQAHKDDDEKKVKVSPYEIVASTTTQTMNDVQEIKQRLASMESMLARHVSAETELDIAPLKKKRSRETMESAMHVAPITLEQAFSSFMAAVEAEGSDIEQTRLKLRKVVDSYFGSSGSPHAVKYMRLVSDAAAAGATDLEQASEDMTDDEDQQNLISFWPTNGPLPGYSGSQDVSSNLRFSSNIPLKSSSEFEPFAGDATFDATAYTH